MKSILFVAHLVDFADVNNINNKIRKTAHKHCTKFEIIGFSVQTIQIRKFLQELEHDALLLDQKLNASYKIKSNKDDLKNFVWMDDDNIGEVFRAQDQEQQDRDTGDTGGQRRQSGKGTLLLGQNIRPTYKPTLFYIVLFVQRIKH